MVRSQDEQINIKPTEETQHFFYKLAVIGSSLQPPLSKKASQTLT